MSWSCWCFRKLTLTEVSGTVWRRKGIESSESGRHFNSPEEIRRCICGKWMRRTRGWSRMWKPWEQWNSNAILIFLLGVTVANCHRLRGLKEHKGPVRWSWRWSLKSFIALWGKASLSVGLGPLWRVYAESIFSPSLCSEIHLFRDSSHGLFSCCQQ